MRHPLRPLRARAVALGRWMLGRWVALDLDARDLEFFGGLALIGFAPWRLAVVGIILVVHGWLGPIVAARRF